MFLTVYRRALEVLLRKPLKLWGLSLLAVLLNVVLPALCGVAIPGLALAVSLLLSTSMTMVYLFGYRGEDVQVLQLFSCFKDWKTIKRVTLGLYWRELWVFLWSLIPIAGPIFALIRGYEYRLTPYILVTEPAISLSDAIKVSKERTHGYKLQMWLADFAIDIAVGVVVGIFLLLGKIPYVGGFFIFIMVVFAIIYAVLRPLFTGLVQAAFYEEITNAANIPEQEPMVTCANCGENQPAGAKFCSNCGQPM